MLQGYVRPTLVLHGVSACDCRMGKSAKLVQHNIALLCQHLPFATSAVTAAHTLPDLPSHTLPSPLATGILILVNTLVIFVKLLFG